MRREVYAFPSTDNGTTAGFLKVFEIQQFVPPPKVGDELYLTVEPDGGRICLKGVIEDVREMENSVAIRFKIVEPKGMSREALCDCLTIKDGWKTAKW